jgi:glycosyltransferase involved in cell wall biosynthesis
MKVLWIAHFVPFPPDGGARLRTYNLLRQAARKFDVDLVALNQRVNLPTSEAVANAVERLRSIVRRVSVFPLPRDTSRPRKLVTAAMSYASPAPYGTQWLSSGPLRDYLRETADTTRHDLVHLDTVDLWQYRNPFRGRPIVLNHHNIESQVAARRAEAERNPLVKHLLSRDAGKIAALERKAVAAVSSNLVVSALDGERLLSVSPQARVRVVENGVDTEFFRSDPSARRVPKSLVFVGGMNWHPNRDAVVWLVEDIWPALLRDDPGRALTLVGRFPPRPAREAAEADTRIRITGFVPDVRPHLDAASVYICPMRIGGGTRLKILDALAMARPLVATRVAVEGLDLEAERHYLPAETPEEFVRQVRRLDESLDLASRLAAAGRVLVEEKYEWERIGMRLESAYRDAVAVGEEP